MQGIESAEVEVIMTDRLLTYIRKTCKDGVTKDLMELNDFMEKEPGVPVPFRLVREMYTKLRRSGHEDVYLHEMMEGSALCLPGVKLPPRNPDLQERIQKLKAAEANREYHEMTKNLGKKHVAREGFGEDVKSMNRQIISVFNFLVTVGGAFVFTYKVVEYSVGPGHFPLQMTAALVVALVVFFADLYFMVKFDAADSKDTKKKQQ